MSAGYSGTPLPRKLGIRPGSTVALVDPPEGFESVLGGLPEGAVAGKGLRGEGRSIDVVVLFVRTEEELEAAFQIAAARIRPDGGLWVAWPKRSSPLAGPLREGDVRRIGLATGLVDNKICAIDEDWSGLRFVHRRENRASLG